MAAAFSNKLAGGRTVRASIRRFRKIEDHSMARLLD